MTVYNLSLTNHDPEAVKKKEQKSVEKVFHLFIHSRTTWSQFLANHSAVLLRFCWRSSVNEIKSCKLADRSERAGHTEAGWKLAADPASVGGASSLRTRRLLFVPTPPGNFSLYLCLSAAPPH